KLRKPVATVVAQVLLAQNASAVRVHYRECLTGVGMLFREPTGGLPQHVPWGAANTSERFRLEGSREHRACVLEGFDCLSLSLERGQGIGPENRVHDLDMLGQSV